jgi:hypothetical protein
MEQLQQIAKEVLAKASRTSKRGGKLAYFCPWHPGDTFKTEQTAFKHYNEKHMSDVSKYNLNDKETTKLLHMIAKSYTFDDEGRKPSVSLYQLNKRIANLAADVRGTEPASPQLDPVEEKSPELGPASSEEDLPLPPAKRAARKAKPITMTSVLFTDIVERTPRLEWKVKLKDFFKEMNVTNYKAVPATLIEEFNRLSAEHSPSSQQFIATLPSFFDKWRQELSRVSAHEKSKFKDVPLKPRKIRKPRVGKKRDRPARLPSKRKVPTAQDIGKTKEEKIKKAKRNTVVSKDKKVHGVLAGIDLITN